MDKGKYVLKAKADRWQIGSDGYYTGKSYVYQHAKYAVVDRDVANAKVYTSRSRADKASEMSFENYAFEVQPIK